MPSTIKRIALLASIGLVFGCPQAFAQTNGEHDKASEKTKTPPKPVSSAQFLYQSLLSEIAAQRGANDVAVRTYIELATKTREPRLARRATELALQGQNIPLASQAASLWLKLEPNSQSAMQTLTAISAENNQSPETLEANVKKQLEKQTLKRGAILIQLPQLLARFQDAKANQVIVYRLSEPYLRLPEAHFARAIAAALAGDGNTGMTEASKALELRPDWEEAAILRLRVSPPAYRAEAAQQLRDFGEKHPKALDARLNYVRWLASEKRKEETVQASAKLLTEAPENKELRYAIMASLAEAGDLAGAETLLRELIESGYQDTDLLKLQLGKVLEQQEKTQAALDAYGEVDEGQHLNAATELKARLLAKTGRLAEAQKHLQQAAQKQPSETTTLQVIEADLLRQANKHMAALETLELVLAVDADNTDALYMSALVAEALKKPELMEQRLRRLIELKPQEAHAYNALGYSFADRNIRLDEAETLLTKALEIAPEDAAILDSMGWLRFRQGRLDAAKDFIQKARGRSNDPEIAMHLVEVLWRADQKEEARTLFKDIQKTGQTPELEALAKRLSL